MPARSRKEGELQAFLAVLRVALLQLSPSLTASHLFWNVAYRTTNGSLFSFLKKSHGRCLNIYIVCVFNGCIQTYVEYVKDTHTHSRTHTQNSLLGTHRHTHTRLLDTHTRYWGRTDTHTDTHRHTDTRLLEREHHLHPTCAEHDTT